MLEFLQSYLLIQKVKSWIKFVNCSLNTFMKISFEEIQQGKHLRQLSFKCSKIQIQLMMISKHVAVLISIQMIAYGTNSIKQILQRHMKSTVRNALVQRRKMITLSITKLAAKHSLNLKHLCQNRRNYSLRKINKKKINKRWEAEVQLTLTSVIQMMTLTILMKSVLLSQKKKLFLLIHKLIVLFAVATRKQHMTN